MSQTIFMCRKLYADSVRDTQVCVCDSYSRLGQIIIASPVNNIAAYCDFIDTYDKFYWQILVWDDIIPPSLYTYCHNDTKGDLIPVSITDVCLVHRKTAVDYYMIFHKCQGINSKTRDLDYENLHFTFFVIRLSVWKFLNCKISFHWLIVMSRA